MKPDIQKKTIPYTNVSLINHFGCVHSRHFRIREARSCSTNFQFVAHLAQTGKFTLHLSNSRYTISFLQNQYVESIPVGTDRLQNVHLGRVDLHPGSQLHKVVEILSNDFHQAVARNHPLGTN